MMISPSSPQARQALQLAIAIEENNACWFHNCAIRFMTYDGELSLLLEELASEERAHKEELLDLYERNFASQLAVDIATPMELQDYCRGLDAIREHFFVIDAFMAQTLLELALGIERYTHRFYLDLTAITNNPEARVIFSRMSLFEEEHEQLFEARIEMEMLRQIDKGTQNQYSLTH